MTIVYKNWNVIMNKRKSKESKSDTPFDDFKMDKLNNRLSPF